MAKKGYRRMSWIGIICWIAVFLIVGGAAGYGTYETVKYFENKKTEQSKVEQEVAQENVQLTDDSIVLYV